MEPLAIGFKALATGHLSWDQVVPLSRLAAEDAAWWCSRGESLTPEQLSALAARSKGAEDDPDRAEHDSLKWRRDEDGVLKYWGRATGEDADRFEAAICRTIERECSPAPGDPREPYDKRAADAMALLAGFALAEMPRLDRANVNVHAQYSPESGFSHAVLGSDVAISGQVFERHCCDGRIRLIFEDPDAKPRAWTEARSPAWPMEEAVRRREVHCRWPGCRRRCGQVHSCGPRSAA